MDSIPFPARELFDNQSYKDYYLKRFGYTLTSIITSRGCPFNCDFCSQPIFGNQFRARSAVNVVDEIEKVINLGYERIWFADDCFTLSHNRLIEICDEIIKRNVKVDWECLSRVDTIDLEIAEKMKKAGCVRLFFGVESGNNSILTLMNKKITTEQARKAVHIAKQAEIKVGAFFIVGYPGETDETILDTVQFASLLPLDYLSFTLPYPIPGTPLHERVKEKLISEDFEEPKNHHLIKHQLLFHSSFSEGKLKFAIIKGMTQFYLRKYFKKGYLLVGMPLERLTDFVFKHLR